MDQGVIKNLKTYYRRKVLQQFLDAAEQNKPTPKISLLDCVTMLASSWNLDVKDSII